MGVTKVKKEKVTGKVEKLDKDGSLLKTEEVPVGEVLVEEPMAVVGFKVGRTKTTGAYESLRVDVSLSMPCKPDQKSIDETFKKCYKWVDKKMTKALK